MNINSNSYKHILKRMFDFEVLIVKFKKRERVLERSNCVVWDPLSERPY